jgi:putative CocE/NonD family hydrolase
MKRCGLWVILAIAASAGSYSTLAAAQAATVQPAVSYLNVMVPMRDGVRLATDIYLPGENVAKPVSGRWPVLMVRTAYNKKPMAYYKTVGNSGYVLVVQDVRGTFASQGDFQPMLNEGADGIDTIAWLIKQPWSDGRVGTFGPSYLGGVQIRLAAEKPPALVASFAEVAATDQFRNEWVYMDGALTGTATLWSINMVADAASRMTPPERELLKSDFGSLDISTVDFSALASADMGKRLVSTLPLREIPVIRRMPWWPEWVGNWDNRQHFQANETNDRLRNVAVPIMHLGGWYDLFLRNTYGNYKEISARAKNRAAAANQRLMIGQWAHDFPSCTFCEANATIDIMALQMAWMDRWFMGTKNPVFDYPVVLYVMGENRWRAEPSWPLAGTQRTRYYLHSQGRANTAAGNGMLSTSMPGTEPADRYTYDPHNPASTLGWVYLRRARTEQNASEARPDVLVFSSPELTEDVEATGEISATLFAASSATDTDWWMKLIDVAPDGKASILTQGLARARYRVSRTKPRPLAPNKIEKYQLNLWATSNVFKQGHRIRVEVTSSNFPYADRNPNAFIDLSRATEKDFVVASQTVYHDARYPSYVELPVIPASRARQWIDTPFPRAASASRPQ